MTQTIWQTLPKPFFVLAPMEDVTDTAFRRLIANCGRPHLFFTEFVNADGLCSAGFNAVAHRLKFTEIERPLIAQIWGNRPENYFKAAQMINELGFDGIDINMGCPVTKVVKRGSCSGLIENPQLAKELILAAKQGAGNLPVSVKTRLGVRKKETENWFPFLLSLDLPAITVHGRIAKHLSKYPADWEEIKKVVEFKNEINPNTLIVGNGDITSYADGLIKHTHSGVDGLMVGRGIFKNPFLFNSSGSTIDIEQMTAHQRISLLKEHIRLFEESWQSRKPFAILKKYFKIYIATFKGAAEFRAELMEAKDLTEVHNLINHALVGEFTTLEHS